MTEIEIKDKIKTWEANTKLFFKAIDDLNIEKAKELLEQGYPQTISKFFNETDLETMSMDLYEDITDDFDLMMKTSFNNLYNNSNKDEMLELLAEYFIFDDKGIGSLFVKSYFMYTKNYKQALKYTDMLVNNMTYLKGFKLSWLSGALYNENHDFFDGFLDVIKKSKNKNENYISALCNKNKNGKYYNIKSWKKCYEEYFETFFDEDDNIDTVFLKLFKSTINQLESSENTGDPKTILNFLIEDYCSFTEIDKLDQILIQLYFSEEKKLQKENDSINHKSPVNIKLLSRAYKTLSIDRKIKNNKELLDKYIDDYIKNNNPKECVDFFKSINLPKEKFNILNNYINLNSDIPNIENEKNKVKKI